MVNVSSHTLQYQGQGGALFVGFSRIEEKVLNPSSGSQDDLRSGIALGELSYSFVPRGFFHETARFPPLAMHADKFWWQDKIDELLHTSFKLECTNRRANK